MENLFKVVTERGKKEIKAFVLFSYRVHHPKATFHLCVIGVGFWAIAAMLRGRGAGWSVCVALGAVINLFAFTRHYIAIEKIKRTDSAYKEKRKTTYVFGSKEVCVFVEGDSRKIMKQYHEVSSLYADEKNYYMGVCKEELYILPRKGFDIGSEKEFQKFIEKKSGVSCIFLPASVKGRLKSAWEYKKRMEKEHDEKLMQKKNK